MLRLFPITTLRQTSKRNSHGFTIIELVIAIAISSILLGLAVPSFVSFLNSNRVTSQANELLTSFQIARMEAIRRNARVIVCSSNNIDSGATPVCATGSTWSGWVVYSDADGDSVIDADEVIKVNSLSAPVVGMASANIDNQVVFRSDGFARSAAGGLLEGTVGICVPTTSPALNVRDVSIDAGSRMGVAQRNSGITCTAPGN